MCRHELALSCNFSLCLLLFNFQPPFLCVILIIKVISFHKLRIRVAAKAAISCSILFYDCEKYIHFFALFIHSIFILFDVLVVCRSIILQLLNDIWDENKYKISNSFMRRRESWMLSSSFDQQVESSSKFSCTFPSSSNVTRYPPEKLCAVQQKVSQQFFRLIVIRLAKIDVRQRKK